MTFPFPYDYPVQVYISSLFVIWEADQVKRLLLLFMKLVFHLMKMAYNHEREADKSLDRALIVKL